MEVRAKLYNEFTEWLENRSKTASAQKDTLQAIGARNWDLTDVKITECNSEYQEVLKGDVTIGDTIAIRLQAAHLKASRRASRLRHETVPRLLAHGCAEQIYIVNGLYKKSLTDEVSFYISSARKSLQEKES